MGFRFRKSKKILPGVKINLGKSGVGATFGGKAGRVSLSPKGTSVGFSLPGTGISYNERVGTKKR